MPFADVLGKGDLLEVALFRPQARETGFEADALALQLLQFGAGSSILQPQQGLVLPDALAFRLQQGLQNAAFEMADGLALAVDDDGAGVRIAKRYVSGF